MGGRVVGSVELSAQVLELNLLCQKRSQGGQFQKMVFGVSVGVGVHSLSSFVISVRRLGSSLVHLSSLE